MKLYETKSYIAKSDAQLNLQGRTHYVDDDTLKFHHSRILETHITDGGLLFALIESCAADMHNTKRVFRPVIFDVFGNVISRTTLDESFKTKKSAVKAMWTELNALSAVEVTEKAIDRHIKNCAREVEYLRQDMAKLVNENKAA